MELAFPFKIHFFFLGWIFHLRIIHGLHQDPNRGGKYEKNYYTFSFITYYKQQKQCWESVLYEIYYALWTTGQNHNALRNGKVINIVCIYTLCTVIS